MRTRLLDLFTMNKGMEENRAKQALVDKLIELATRAFKPDADLSSKAQDERAFDEFFQR